IGAAVTLLVSCGEQKVEGTNEAKPRPAHDIGGTVLGLVGTVLLENNASDDLSISANGVFAFPATITEDGLYNITVLTQPAGQTCTVANGAGAVSKANVTNVIVTCAANAFSVGGTVSGLSGNLVLQVNHGNNLGISASGPFAFATPVADGSKYNVTVLTQPAGQSCSVTGGTGTIAGANIANVSVICAYNTFTVGGTVSGLSGSLVLQNNSGNNLTVSANGGFTFPTAVRNGSAYNVTVLAAPSGQSCTVTNGVGTVSGANILNVGINCV